MQFEKHNIQDVNTWYAFAPPMGGAKQWKDGRSAKELAKYMTSRLPLLPPELERALAPFAASDAVFSWNAEYVTDFSSHDLGRGEGRNHDAVMWNDTVFVGIEGKADESLGNGFVASEYAAGSDNKKKRIAGLTDMIWGDHPENHPHIRYQLLTASAAVLLEANDAAHRVKKAMLIVLVFKKTGAYRQEKIDQNNADIRSFLIECGAIRTGDCYRIPTKYGEQHGINLYFQKIDIDLEE